MLSALMQAAPANQGDPTTGDPTTGREIRYDAAEKSEKLLADALFALLGDNITPTPKPTSSKWYLSIFSCSAGTPPGNQPAPTGPPSAAAP